MPCSSHHSLTRRLPVIPTACAVVHLLAGSTQAWPFVDRNTGAGFSSQKLDQPLAIQTAGDRPIEIFTGGPEVLQLSANQGGSLSAQRINLPLPDYDPYAAGLAPVSFGSGRGTAGDIDGDGDIDLVYSAVVKYNGSEEWGNVRVVACRNNGDGTWTRQWQIKSTSGLNGAPAVRLADLDRDGDPDFIESSTGVRIRWNDGSGNYSTSSTLTTLIKAAPDVEVADFDGNGWPDVAVFGSIEGIHPDFPLWLTGRLTVFWNDAGTFTTANLLTLEGGVNFMGCGLADVDGDGRTDLLAVRERYNGGSDLHWHRNTGAGFAAPVLLFSFPSSGLPEIRFHPGDLDEDGVLDLVFSTKQGEVQWLRGTGGGAFAAPVVLRTGGGSGHGDPLSVADFDGDGDPDIFFGYGVTWLENRSIRMRCAASAAAWSGINPSGTVKLTTGDVNSDGKDDLVVADGGATRIRWYAGTGTGLEVPSFVSTGNLQPLGVATGDFNGDGFTDLAWTTTDTLKQALSTNGSGFSWNITTAATMSGISDIVSGDMDRDGDTDILSTAPSAGTIRIHSNNGSASSWLPQNVDTGINNLQRLATGQLIPGGRPEVVTLSSGFYVNRHHYHNGSWQYSAIANQGGGTGSLGVVVAEVSDNLPGPEAIYALGSNAIYYDHENLFQPVLVGNTTHPVTQLAAVDWNRDGFTDILAATTYGVSIYPNSRSAVASFQAPFTLLTGTSIQDLVVMRLDGDAYPDAVASQSVTGQLHLITNTTAAVEYHATAQATRKVLPGATAMATNILAAHRGQRSQELRCAPATVFIRFLRSNLVGGVDSPGTALSQSEVSALVESVHLEKGGLAWAGTVPTGVTAGMFTLYPSSQARVGLALNNGALSDIQLMVKLKPTAGSSAVQRFYVEFSPGGSHWVALDDAGNSSPLFARKRGNTDIQSTLFVVDPPGPLENWRMTWFGQYDGSGIAANDHDADGDGLTNLVEYVASRNPTAATGLSELNKPLIMVRAGPGDPVTAEVRILQTLDDSVTVRLQNSTTMQFWSNMATRSGSGSWVGKTPTTTLLSGGRALYKFNTAVSPNDEPDYFMRLSVEETP